jgi:hypothetical protein
MQPYKSKEWRQFRANVILLDNHLCTRCGRHDDDGVTLHVHHKIYRKGRLPWEYALDDCETLCAGCHAEHHGKIPPKVGWEFAGYDDLGDLIGSCELCGTEIRYVFLVYHSNWPVLEVGEICCDHLTCTELASNHMESIRRFNERRKRFVGSPRWQLCRPGQEFLFQGSILVEIRQLDGGFQVRMNGKKGRQIFPDLISAKARAFDVLESTEHSEFVDGIRRQPAPSHVLLGRP